MISDEDTPYEIPYFNYEKYGKNYDDEPDLSYIQTHYPNYSNPPEQSPAAPREYPKLTSAFTHLLSVAMIT